MHVCRKNPAIGGNSARSVAISARMTSFCPLAIGQVHASVSQLIHNENQVFAIAEVLKILYMVLSCAEL